MTEQEILELLSLNNKKRITSIGKEFLLSLETYDDPLYVRDFVLYKIWWGSVTSNGYHLSKHLANPNEKNLNHLGNIFATFCTVFDFKKFPVFLDAVYGSFYAMVSYLQSRHYTLPFEPHMLGVFEHNLTPIIEWYASTVDIENCK